MSLESTASYLGVPYIATNRKKKTLRTLLEEIRETLTGCQDELRKLNQK
jgi:hypothetical protein